MITVTEEIVKKLFRLFSIKNYDKIDIYYSGPEGMSIGREYETGKSVRLSSLIDAWGDEYYSLGVNGSPGSALSFPKKGGFKSEIKGLFNDIDAKQKAVLWNHKKQLANKNLKDFLNIKL